MERSLTNRSKKWRELNAKATADVSDAVRSLQKGSLPDLHRVFDIDFGKLKLVSLGKMVGCNGCVFRDIAYPVDYHSRRMYTSWATGEQVWYHCKTFKTQEGMMFSITHPEGESVSSTNATTAVRMAHRKIANADMLVSSTPPQGNLFFGFSCPSIWKLLTCLPNYATVLKAYASFRDWNRDPKKQKASEYEPTSKRKKHTIHPVPASILNQYTPREVDCSEELAKYLIVMNRYVKKEE